MASSADRAAPVESNGAKRHAERPLRREGQNGSYKYKTKRMRNGHGETSKILRTNGTHEEVLLHDVTALIAKMNIVGDGATSTSTEEVQTPETLPERLSEISVTIHDISSTGDGLGFQTGSPSRHVYIVPFTAPGDIVTAKIFKHFEREHYTMADLLSVTIPSPHRDISLIACPYFASCSGCQFQMLPYSLQLAHKKTIVEKAYKNFSGLPASAVPAVGDTIGSPLQYGYRTKLTPHFDGPPDARRSDGRKGVRRAFKEVPPIGFMKKGTRLTIDIEDCPIGTDAVRAGMRRERRRVAERIGEYSRGATILLRESTERVKKSELDVMKEDPDVVVEEKGEYVDRKTCITDSNATSTEYVGDWVFENPAGSFFQNNNAILPVFTSYIRDHILPPAPTGSSPHTPPTSQIKHLIDAYSGSGLFTITLSPTLRTSLGIDISSSSIASATHNAALNQLPPSSTRFIAADAAALFASITTPADETVVVVDPPRKGCDEGFLRQLLEFGPARVVYVSCNVHTQARDVGVLVRGLEEWGREDGENGGARYEIESLRGFDFFPQTGHVEGVAVLRRRENTTTGEVQQQGLGDVENDKAENAPIAI